MSNNNSPFGDEWRACLKEHYQYVVRQNDLRTLDTLTAVLHHPAINYSDATLRQWYIEATMHVDDVAPDFVPDMDFINGETAQPTLPASQQLSGEQPTFLPHPLECQCPQCVTINLKPHDDEGQPLTDEALAEHEERQRYEEAKRRDDLPKQLSLF